MQGEMEESEEEDADLLARAEVGESDSDEEPGSAMAIDEEGAVSGDEPFDLDEEIAAAGSEDQEDDSDGDTAFEAEGDSSEDD
jgi:hypothetical protein